MNKTNNIHNNNKNKLFIASIAIVVALALFASPIVAMDDAFATKKKYKGGNVAQQSISQSQASVQNALCASGGTTFLSCNNVSFQNQKNTGNNALAQQDDDNDNNGGNSAEQSISQSQSSSQNSQVVSGGDTIGSGNNINVQNQENTGNNALAQS
jgi:preprotein translocase subunit SecF